MKVLKYKGQIIVWVIVVLSLALLIRSIYFNHIKPKYSLGLFYRQIEETIHIEDFELELTSGVNVKLSDLEGQVVILSFWQLGESQDMLYELDQVDIAFAEQDRNFVLALNYKDDPAKVNDFLMDNWLYLPVPLDTIGEITDGYNIENVPTTFIINPDGTLYDIILGHTNKGTILSIVDRLEKNL